MTKRMSEGGEGGILLTTTVVLFLADIRVLIIIASQFNHLDSALLYQ